MRKIIILASFTFTMMMAASVCTDAYKKVDKKTKEYSRIISHINEYQSSCNVVYAYSIFLHNPTEMDLLEKDNTYAERLGGFVKDYPYASKLIANRKVFEFFDHYGFSEKTIINKSVKRSFSQYELKNKKNLIYVQMALQIVGDGLNNKTLTRQIKILKRQYTLDDMKVVLELWGIVKAKYKNSYRDNNTLFTLLEQTIYIYTLRTLKNYTLYSADFYPVLLPKKLRSKTYMQAMKSLMNTLNVNHTSMEQQAFFLKNISLDIEIALADGYTQDEIVQYFKAFVEKRFINQFGQLNCSEKQGLAMLASDHLDAKLKWKNDDKSLFYKIIKELKKVRGTKEKLNILGLYNYAAGVYGSMDTPKKKEMFEYLANLPTKNVIFNLSLIYALGENTPYFKDIINNPNRLYTNKAYGKMLYDIRDDGVVLLELYRNKKTRQKFYKEITFLVNEPNEIGEMTTNEKIEFAVDTMDYLSYATMITGVGIVANLGKALMTRGIKGTIKQGGKLVVTELKTMKGQVIRQWETRSLDTAADVLPRKKIRELSKLSDDLAPKAVWKEIQKMNLTPVQQDAVYLRIAIRQNKLSKKEAARMFKNLAGKKGFREGLSKVIGNSKAKTRGHLNELRIANHASEKGFEVVEIGKRFNDGIKRGDSDIDIMLRKNGQDIVIEAKQYSKKTKMPLDKFRGDLDTLRAYETSHPNKNVLKVFTFTKKPQSKDLLRQYEFWAKKKGVKLIFGTPKQQIDEIAKLTHQGVSEIMLASMFMSVPVVYGVYQYFYTSEQKQLCER